MKRVWDLAAVQRTEFGDWLDHYLSKLLLTEPQPTRWAFNPCLAFAQMMLVEAFRKVS